MAQACSLSSSIVDVNGLYNNKRLPKGIHIVGAEEKSVSKVGGISQSETEINDSHITNDTYIQNHCCPVKVGKSFFETVET